MSLSTPSDEVQMRMEALRIEQEKQMEIQRENLRLWEEKKIEKEKAEAEKTRIALIDAEALIRIQIARGEYKKDSIIEKLNAKKSPKEICDAILDPYRPYVQYRPYVHVDPIDKLKIDRKKEILLEFVSKINDEYLAEKKAEQDKIQQDALQKFRQDIDKANKSLPKHKLNGGVYDEGRRKIDFISNQWVSTPGWGGLSYETIYREEWYKPWEGIEKRSSVTIPTEWNDDYSKGILPFLTQCPSCKKQNTIYFKPTGSHDDSGAYYSSVINTVQCSHYKWEGSKHYKFIVHSNLYHQWVEWDPSDPDGSKAAEAKRLADIADLEAQVVALQLKIAGLKRV